MLPPGGSICRRITQHFPLGCLKGRWETGIRDGTRNPYPWHCCSLFVLTNLLRPGSFPLRTGRICTANPESQLWNSPSIRERQKVSEEGSHLRLINFVSLNSRLESSKEEKKDRAFAVKVEGKRLPVFRFSGLLNGFKGHETHRFENGGTYQIRKTGKRKVVFLQPLPQTL